MPSNIDPAMRIPDRRLITPRPLLKHFSLLTSRTTGESPFHSIALLNLEKDNPPRWSSHLMPSPPHLILRFVACLSASCLVAGCSSSDARAQRALEDYQAASAAN